MSRNHSNVFQKFSGQQLSVVVMFGYVQGRKVDNDSGSVIDYIRDFADISDAGMDLNTLKARYYNYLKIFRDFQKKKGF
jgi:hypothetical protein